jgi:hypothetical protein
MSSDQFRCLYVRRDPGHEPELLGGPVKLRRPGGGPAPYSVAVDAPAPTRDAPLVTTSPRVAPSRFPLLIEVRSRLRHRRGMPSPVAV